MDDPCRGAADLLEPEGTRTFVGEYLAFTLDASRVLWVPAGSDLPSLPAPIVDRLTVPTLREGHPHAIAASIYDDANADRGRRSRPSMREAAIARLLETNPGGMREAVDLAMTRAAADRRRTLFPDDVVPARPPRRVIALL